MIILTYYFWQIGGRCWLFGSFAVFCLYWFNIFSYALNDLIGRRLVSSYRLIQPQNARFWNTQNNAMQITDDDDADAGFDAKLKNL
jgi:hypothetical protein